MQAGTRRFACTQCGKCCNRSPEVELAEAAALADVFVFRLMFRLYHLPRAPEAGGSRNVELFYQKKRLLAAHAARTYSKKAMRDGKPVERLHYLMVSALAMDTAPGLCAALEDGRCAIHDRRPLTCRSVPFHYSRADALALSDFDSFVGTAGHLCDTSEAAALFVEDGRIVDRDTLRARSDAAEQAERDRPWKEAIVRRMKAVRSSDDPLPSLRDVEANAAVAAMTTSMRVGWQIAADAGLLGDRECRGLIERQLAVIDRELTLGRSSPDDRETLREMSAEYRHALAR